MSPGVVAPAQRQQRPPLLLLRPDRHRRRGLSHRSGLALLQHRARSFVSASRTRTRERDRSAQTLCEDRRRFTGAALDEAVALAGGVEQA
jgi:hypothetical protein